MLSTIKKIGEIVTAVVAVVIVIQKIASAVNGIHSTVHEIKRRAN